MATLIAYTSPYVESYEGKSDEWLKARLDFFEQQELLKESLPRRKEIRRVRVEIRRRQQLKAPTLPD